MNKFLIQRRKTRYYLKNFFKLFIPKALVRIHVHYELNKVNNYDLTDLESRGTITIKLKKFQIDSEALNINDPFRVQIKNYRKIFQNKKIKKNYYFFDLYKYLSYFLPFKVSQIWRYN